MAAAIFLLPVWNRSSYRKRTGFTPEVEIWRSYPASNRRVVIIQIASLFHIGLAYCRPWNLIHIFITFVQVKISWYLTTKSINPKMVPELPRSCAKKIPRSGYTYWWLLSSFIHNGTVVYYCLVCLLRLETERLSDVILPRTGSARTVSELTIFYSNRPH